MVVGCSIVRKMSVLIFTVNKWGKKKKVPIWKVANMEKARVFFYFSYLLVITILDNCM